MQLLSAIKEYYIGTRPFSDGSHIVHRHDCPLLPKPGKRIHLGAFHSPAEAAKEGTRHYDDPVCCRFCSKEENQKEIIPVSEVKTGVVFISYDRLKPTLESLMLCSVS